jgi:hypothetical protein
MPLRAYHRYRSKPAHRFRKYPCGEVFDMHGHEAVGVDEGVVAIRGSSYFGGCKAGDDSH